MMDAKLILRIYHDFICFPAADNVRHRGFTFFRAVFY